MDKYCGWRCGDHVIYKDKSKTFSTVNRKPRASHFKTEKKRV